MTDVVSLGAKRAFAENDNRLWTAEEMMQEAIREGVGGKGLALVFLSEEGEGEERVNYWLSNIHAHELLSLLERAKYLALSRLED